MASALFEIDPATGVFGTAGDPADVAGTGGVVRCRINNLTGVNPGKIDWTIIGTHSSSQDKPTITLSGRPVGQIATFTVPAGQAQAYGIQLKVNGGTSQTNSSGDTKTSAVFVLNDFELRPFFVGETSEEDSTHGITTRLNDMFNAVAGPGKGDWKESVRLGTTAALAAHTFSAGVITITAFGALAAIDGATPNLLDLILVQDEGATSLEHGIFKYTTLGDGSTSAVLTRDLLSDEDAEFTPGLTVFVEEGTANGGREFKLDQTGTIVLNTTPLSFTIKGEVGSGTDRAIATWDASGTAFRDNAATSIDASGNISTTGRIDIGSEPGTSGAINIDQGAFLASRRTSTGDRLLIGLATATGIQISQTTGITALDLFVSTTGIIGLNVGGGAAELSVHSDHINLLEPLFLAANGAHNDETLAAGKTLTLADPHYHQLDGAASDRTITLPAEATSTGNWYHIQNDGTTNALDVENDAAGAIVTIGFGESAILICNGTVWIAFLILSNTAASTTIEFVAARQASDLTLTNAVPGTDATDLTITLAIGTWFIKASTVWTCGAASTDGFTSDWSFAGTSTSQRRWMTRHNATGSTHTDAEHSTSLGSNFSTVGIADDIFTSLEYLCIVVSAAGTLTYRASKQADAGADTTFEQDSFIEGSRKI